MKINIYFYCVTLTLITLALKSRRKGMIIILCVCKIGKTTNIGGSNELLDFIITVSILNLSEGEEEGRVEGAKCLNETLYVCMYV